MKNKGFTLIELMIVVSIIGILAAIALPSYQDYTIRAQTAEAMILATEIKSEITGYYKARGSFPVSNKAAGLPEPEYLIGNYVAGIEINNGAVHITLGNRINAQAAGKIISFRPLTVIDSPSSPISWACGYASAPKGMEAVGENHTNIEVRMISWACRE